MLSLKGDIYEDFIGHLKSNRTKDLYKRALIDYSNYLKVSDLEELLKLKDISKSIIKYLDYLNGKGYSYSQINIAKNALSYFYMRNDIINLNWKKIAQSLPEAKTRQDRPYTREEIRKMINIAPSLMVKSILLLLSSSGIRLGAVCDLDRGDLKEVDNLYEIRVYKDSVKYNYATYCTPECRFYIDEYLKDRQHDGEKITDESPLFRHEYDRTQANKNVRKLDYGGLKSILRRLRFRAGVIDKSKGGRYETSLTNGFRKFHYNMCSEAAVRPSIIDRLEGRSLPSVGERHYHRPAEPELLEQYKKAINNLTVDDSFRLQEKLDTIEKKQQAEIESLRNQLKELQEKQEDIIKRKLDGIINETVEELNQRIPRLMEEKFKPTLELIKDFKKRNKESLEEAKKLKGYYDILRKEMKQRGLMK